MRTWLLGVLLSCLCFPAVAADQLTGTLKRISDSGNINIGYRADDPPMSFRDRDGNAVGYSIDLCGHIVAAVKAHLGRSDITVNAVPVTAETRFAAVESGEIDLLCGVTTKTLGRAERVGFTQLTFVTGGTLLSMNDAAVPNVASLKGKRVAVTANTTTIESLKKTLSAQLIDAEVVPVQSAIDGMALLEQREVDAFAADQVVLIGQVIARQNSRQFFLSEQFFSFEPFAIALARGDADFQLVADRALSQLNRSGQIAKIYRRWFERFTGEMPPALKALYQLNATPE